METSTGRVVTMAAKRSATVLTFLVLAFGLSCLAFLPLILGWVRPT
jgi:hypothetical protein